MIENLVARTYERGQEIDVESAKVINVYVQKFGKDAKIQKKEDDILKSNNVGRIIAWAKFVNCADTEACVEALLPLVSTTNCEKIIKFVKGKGKATVAKFQNAVIALNNAYWIYEFTLQIKGADIQKSQKAIIELQDASIIYNFALNIGGADIDALIDAIIDNKNAEYIYLMALNVAKTEDQRKKLEDALVATREYDWFVEYAANVSGANVARLQRWVTKYGTAEQIYKFALNVIGAGIETLLNRLIELRSVEYIILFAANVPGANISRCQDATKRFGTADQIDSFAEIVPGAKKTSLKKLALDLRNTDISEIDSLLDEI